MSRIGKRTIDVSKGVTVDVQGLSVTVKGPKGTLHHQMPSGLDISQKEGKLTVTRQQETREGRSLHGVNQSLINNMVKGVTDGFAKDLEIQGVGFKAEVKGKNLQLNLGFSHLILFPIPEGIQIKVTNQTAVTIEGCDRSLVGQVAANIRELKMPEPYQGKGIRYKGEIIVRKVGKAAAGAAGG